MPPRIQTRELPISRSYFRQLYYPEIKIIKGFYEKALFFLKKVFLHTEVISELIHYKFKMSAKKLFVSSSER